MFDDFLRKRASQSGAKLLNGLFMGMDVNGEDGITIRYNQYEEGECQNFCPKGLDQPTPDPSSHPPTHTYSHHPPTPPACAGSKVGTPAKLEVDVVIGADGANSRVAKEIDAGEFDYAIAFQVCTAAVSLLLFFVVFLLFCGVMFTHERRSSRHAPALCGRGGRLAAAPVWQPLPAARPSPCRSASAFQRTRWSTTRILQRCASWR